MAQDEASDLVENDVAEERRQVTARALRHRAELFARLSAFEPFQELLNELGRKERRMRDMLLGRAMSGEAIDQRQVDYDRGFVDGMKYVHAVTTAAERTLERADAEADAAESEPDDKKGLWD